MIDCPVCKSSVADDASFCARCGAQFKSQVRLSKPDTAVLLKDGFAFYASTLDDAVAMRDALTAAGIKVIVSTEDLTALGISLHDTHGYKIVVHASAAEQAFEILRVEVPRALFSELESGLGIDISEALSWPLNPDFRMSLLPGITTEEFLEKALGPQRTETLLKERESRAQGPDAVRKTLEDAFAQPDQDHDPLFQSLSRSSAGAFDVLFDGLLRAVREGRDDVLWPAAKVVKRLRREGFERRLPDLAPLVRASEPQIRRFAALALGIIGDPATAHYLIELLRDSDETVRYEAVDGLFELTGEDLGYVSDSPEAERTAASRRWDEWLADRTQ